MDEMVYTIEGQHHQALKNNDSKQAILSLSMLELMHLYK